MTNLTMTGGDNGSYQIFKGNAARPVAIVRRNQKGGGYTAELLDETASIQLRNIPAEETSEAQAKKIMALLTS